MDGVYKMVRYSEIAALERFSWEQLFNLPGKLAKKDASSSAGSDRPAAPASSNPLDGYDIEDIEEC